MSTWWDLKYLTAKQQVVINEICETPVLVATQAADLIGVITHARVAKHHACMTTNGIVLVNRGPVLMLHLQTLVKMSSAYLTTMKLVKTRTRNKI